MNTYRVIGRISHNGIRYFPGNEIDLSEDEAEVLSGAIDLSSIFPKKNPSKKTPKVSEEAQAGEG
jgi:hypothetical protein